MIDRLRVWTLELRADALELRALVDGARVAARRPVAAVTAVAVAGYVVGWTLEGVAR